MKVKVCGITTVQQLQQLAHLGVDYAGIIFYRGSKRYAGNLSAAAEEVKNVDIKKIGVFVNADKEEVLVAIKNFHLYAVQLHGEESEEYCKTLMQYTKVIKAFRIANESDIEIGTASYKRACDFFLFDTAGENYGGNGKKFDWSDLHRAAIEKPFFLSGGISDADAPAVLSFSHPVFYGVDVNSRFEQAPGIKNMTVIKSFMEQIKDKHIP